MTDGKTSEAAAGPWVLEVPIPFPLKATPGQQVVSGGVSAHRLGAAMLVPLSINLAFGFGFRLFVPVSWAASLAALMPHFLAS